MAKKQEPVCKKTYIDGDGNSYATMPADPSAIVALSFGFLDDGEAFVYHPEDYSDNMRKAFEFFGASEALGNSYAGVKGDIDAARENLAARNQTILAGFWRSGGGGGGSKMDSILVEAVIATYADADIEKAADVIRAYFLCEDFVGSEDDLKTERTAKRKKWMKRDDTSAHYARIKAERDALKVTLASDSDEAVTMLDDIE